MTMKKVIVFLLITAIALGGIGFAHALVTDSQDDLILYPTAQVGDPSVLEGLTASMTFACGDHLRWYTDHTFGGETATTFHYDRKGIPENWIYDSNYLDIYLVGGLSASTTGTFVFRSTEYGDLFRAVADATANGETVTMELPLAEYADYYVPDYSLGYEDDTYVCSESASLHGHLMADGAHGEEGSYHDFFSRFRFPVRGEDIVSVALEKNAAGGICFVDFTPLNSPELFFAGDCTAEGVWFVPMFRDENGIPLAYESPEGHGIYFAPWKTADTTATYYTQNGRRTRVTPDLMQLKLVYPLAEDLLIDTIGISDGQARLLTQSGDAYTLTIIDLSTGAVTLKLEVLPFDPDCIGNSGSFLEKNGYILITAQQKLALVDLTAGQVVLTAEDTDGYASWFTPETGDLRFDGQTLLLMDAVHFAREGAFWTAAYRQGKLAYYGEYDCSLLRGNDDFYNAAITIDQDPVRWK